MQAKDSYLADVGRYLILLAKTLKAVAADSTLNPDFLANAFTVYNSRWEQMGTPLIRLALFLHPGYRVVGTQANEFKILCKQVCKAYLSLVHKVDSLLINFDLTDECMLLRCAQTMSMGPLHSKSYGMTYRKFLFIINLWRTLSVRSLPRVKPLTSSGLGWAVSSPIGSLSRLLAAFLSITPHAADPERAFSFMVMTHSSNRNRFKPSTVGSMAQIKSYLLIQPPDEV